METVRAQAMVGQTPNLLQPLLFSDEAPTLRRQLPQTVPRRLGNPQTLFRQAIQVVPEPLLTCTLLLVQIQASTGLSSLDPARRARLPPVRDHPFLSGLVRWELHHLAPGQAHQLALIMTVLNRYRTCQHHQHKPPSHDLLNVRHGLSLITSRRGYSRVTSTWTEGLSSSTSKPDVQIQVILPPRHMSDTHQYSPRISLPSMYW